MFKRPSKTKQPESETHAYEYCMFLLNIRLRSEGELRYGMTQRGYTENVIEQVINRLFELKYIDDSRFLEILVEKIKMERVSEKNQCTKIVDKNQADQIDWDYFIERKNYQDWRNGYGRFHS